MNLAEACVISIHHSRELWANSINALVGTFCAYVLRCNLSYDVDSGKATDVCIQLSLSQHWQFGSLRLGLYDCDPEEVDVDEHVTSRSAVK